MSFTDDLKRSLGFEETESNNKNKNQGPGFAELIKDLIKPKQLIIRNRLIRNSNTGQMHNISTGQIRSNSTDLLIRLLKDLLLGLHQNRNLFMMMTFL